MAIGKKVEKYQAEKVEKRRKERLKKFPSIAISGRPLPQLRQGSITPQEKAVVQLLVEDQPQDISKEQVDALAMLLRRTKNKVQELILSAREQFASNAKEYVDVHLKAVRSATAAGHFDVAANHAEWALKNLTAEGVNIIEEKVAKTSGGGPRVLIGVNLGGSVPKVIDQ